MIILGIDPGVATVGFGLIRTSCGRQDMIRCGVISTPPDRKLSDRLAQIHNDLIELIDMFSPDVIAIEELFFNTNHKTGIAVAHARGVILLAGVEKGIPMYEYTPLQVKQAVAGYGRADKKQVMDMVKRLLRLNDVAKPDDASDALAIAICHARFAGSIMNQHNGEAKCSTI
ncbi:MAG: crossover junction endodeoxyribonuclease RuvC [Ruminococcaceae bacterium]|nr:crossover junction endodeoxyribonuclease RuvC [Oscillospiraceae bacterium]